jgi:hypothetical protein
LKPGALSSCGSTAFKAQELKPGARFQQAMGQLHSTCTAPPRYVVPTTSCVRHVPRGGPYARSTLLRRAWRQRGGLVLTRACVVTFRDSRDAYAGRAPRMGRRLSGGRAAVERGDPYHHAASPALAQALTHAHEVSGARERRRQRCEQGLHF